MENGKNTPITDRLKELGCASALDLVPIYTKDNVYLGVVEAGSVVETYDEDGNNNIVDGIQLFIGKTSEEPKW